MKTLAGKIAAVLISTLLALIATDMLLAWLIPQPLGMLGRMPSPTNDYYLNRPNATTRHRLGNSTATYNVNSIGMRGPAYIPSVPSVLILGDSFVFGLHLDQRDTLTAKLQTLADQQLGKGKLQILNGAVPGWGLADQLAYMQDYARRVHPTLVVSIVNYTSISISYANSLFTFDGIKLRRSQPPASTDLPLPKANAFGQYDDNYVRRWLYDHSQIAIRIKRLNDQIEDLIQNWRSPPHGSTSDQPQPFTSDNIDRERVEAFTRAIIAALDMESKKLGANFLLAEEGFRWQMPPKVASISVDLVGLTALPRIANDLGVYFVDPTSKMKEAISHSEILATPNDGHPTALANEILASQLWPAIRLTIGHGSE